MVSLPAPLDRVPPFLRQAATRHAYQAQHAAIRWPVFASHLLLRALGQGDRVGLAMIGAQILGCIEGPLEALRRLRQPGPPRLNEEGAEP